MSEELKYIIESLLFVSEGPLPMDRLKKVLEEFDPKAIRQAMDALAEEYEARGGGFMLREVAGGFQIRTRPDFAPWIKRLVQPGPQRLSKAALETLAIIAYKQPVIRADIEFIRGVDCGGVLRMLMEKKLVRVLGRKEIPGRPMIYATTKHFLEIFDLKDLKDLPSPSEIEALGASHILDMELSDAEDGETGYPELKADSDTDTNTRGSFTEADVETLENQEDAPEPTDGPDSADDIPDETQVQDEPADPATPPVAETDMAENDDMNDLPLTDLDEPAKADDADSTAMMVDETPDHPADGASTFPEPDIPAFPDETPNAEDDTDEPRKGDAPDDDRPDPL